MSIPLPPRWRRAAPWLAPALLLALALAQLGLARGAALSPWKGGGFGMFSTTDHGGFRSLRLFAVGPTGARRVPVPPGLTGRALRASELPSVRALEGFARAALRRSPEAFGDADRVRVEVWRQRFDPETLEPRAERLRQRELRAADG